MSQAIDPGGVILLGQRAGDELSDRIRRLAAEELSVADDLARVTDLLDRAPAAVVVVDLRQVREPWEVIERAISGRADYDDGSGPGLLVVGDDDCWPAVTAALASGADDCVRLPIEDTELAARLRSVAAPVLARADERRVLGEAIHSDSLQVLAALTMRLQMMQRRTVRGGGGLDDVTAETELDGVIKDMGDVLERLRSLDFDLRRGGTAIAGTPGSAGRDTPETDDRSGPPVVGAPSLWASPELLGRLSHDLRSPLNAVLGFAQLLDLGDLSPEQRDATRQIMRAGTRLLELVNEVVDLSRIEAGHLSVSLEGVDIHDVIRDAVDLLRPAALDNEVSVRMCASLASSESIQLVLADRQRLLQVLLILLSNAVRYNQPGGHVEVDVVPEGRRVRLVVKDDGMGISSGQLHNVFVPFDRLGVDKQGIDGAGLGLPIAKGLVNRMGGDIEVHSSPEEGSTFSFDLRLAPRVNEASADGDALPVAVAVDETLFEVLYIEDNPASLRLVERILHRRPGISLIPAMQGRLGVQLAIQRHPSMVLVDLHLPDMTGIDVVRALFADPATKDLPIVVLSADAERHQSERVLAEGARAYLSKPFQIDALLAIVDAIRRGAAESEPEPREPSL